MPGGPRRRWHGRGERSPRGAGELELTAARDLAGLLDLTRLGATDTRADVQALCAQAVAPGDGRPPVAAVCVWPALVGTAVEALTGTDVRVATVGAGFPSGQLPPEARTADVRAAIAAGAHEVDMVIPRGSFLAGDLDDVRRAVADVAEVCGERTLKVILETCELGDDDAVRAACDLVLGAAPPARDGARFLKTSTGKGAAGATRAHVRILCEAARAFAERTGVRVGIKPAGGIRTTEQAEDLLACIADVLEPSWLVPRTCRIGSSRLL